MNSSDDPSITDKGIGEKCGVAAVWTRSNQAPQIARRASVALQHRGQESSGIALFDKDPLRSHSKNSVALARRTLPSPDGERKKGFIKVHTGMGLIARVLTDDILGSLGPSYAAIAHNRYSTSGGSSLMNAHPISHKFKTYRIAIAHNGNIPDLTWLKSQIKNHPTAETDTALIAALLVEKRPQYSSWEQTFINVLPNIKGAYSLTVLTEDGCVWGVRDPFGVRPLSLGELDDGWIIASESVALDAVGANFIRDVKQGEIIKIDKSGHLTSYFFGPPQRLKLCLFEHIYFSRPDSFINGKRIKTLREQSGEILAKRLKKKGIKPDIVIPIFNSGYFAARGVAEGLKLPLVDAIITSNYFGRTFINPRQEMRINAVYGKHAIIPDEVVGKKVVFVDDSIVRSNTSTILARALKDAGASKVYAAIASPPVVNQCDMGIDMRTKEELPASKYQGELIDSIESKMAQLIKVDDLAYLPLKEVCQAMEGTIDDFYAFPFGGRHPVRDKQEIFPKRKIKLFSKPKLLMLATKKTDSLKTLIRQINKNEINVDLSGVVNNQKQLGSKISQVNPNIVLVTDFEEELDEKIINDCQKKEIAIIRFVPHLINENFGKMARTSRGEVKVFHGENSPRISFEKNLPISGVSVYQVRPKGKHLPILVEEVRRKPNDNLDSWLKRIRTAQGRVLETALKKVVHVFEFDIGVSKGVFPW